MFYCKLQTNLDSHLLQEAVADESDFSPAQATALGTTVQTSAWGPLSPAIGAACARAQLAAAPRGGVSGCVGRVWRGAARVVGKALN